MPETFLLEGSLASKSRHIIPFMSLSILFISISIHPLANVKSIS